MKHQIIPTQFAVPINSINFWYKREDTIIKYRHMRTKSGNFLHNRNKKNNKCTKIEIPSIGPSSQTRVMQCHLLIWTKENEFYKMYRKLQFPCTRFRKSDDCLCQLQKVASAFIAVNNKFHRLINRVVFDSMLGIESWWMEILIRVISAGLPILRLSVYLIIRWRKKVSLRLG